MHGQVAAHIEACTGSEVCQGTSATSRRSACSARKRHLAPPLRGLPAWGRGPSPAAAPRSRPGPWVQGAKAIGWGLRSKWLGRVRPIFLFLASTHRNTEKQKHTHTHTHTWRIRIIPFIPGMRAHWLVTILAGSTRCFEHRRKKAASSGGIR